MTQSTMFGKNGQYDRWKAMSDTDLREGIAAGCHSCRRDDCWIIAGDRAELRRRAALGTSWEHPPKKKR